MKKTTKYIILAVVFVIAAVLFVVAYRRGAITYCSHRFAFRSYNPTKLTVLNSEDIAQQTGSANSCIKIEYGDMSLSVPSEGFEEIIYSVSQDEKCRHQSTLVNNLNYSFRIDGPDFTPNILSINKFDIAFNDNGRFRSYDLLNQDAGFRYSPNFKLVRQIAETDFLSFGKFCKLDILSRISYQGRLYSQSKMLPGQNTYIVKTKDFDMIVNGIIVDDEELLRGKFGSYIKAQSDKSYAIYVFDKSERLFHMMFYLPKYSVISDIEEVKRIYRLLSSLKFRNTEEPSLELIEKWQGEWLDNLRNLSNEGLIVRENLISIVGDHILTAEMPI